MQAFLELVLDPTELVVKLVERTNVSQAHLAPFHRIEFWSIVWDNFVRGNLLEETESKLESPFQ